MTVFASARNWSNAKHLTDACKKHGVTLTKHGEVIHNGEVVGTYELVGGVLVVTDIPHTSPVLAAFDLRQVG